MENTRIPKPGSSGIRPPSKIQTFGNKGMSSQQPSINPIPVKATNHPLRRRSKSVTDLRSVSSKPLTALKPTTKTNIVLSDKVKVQKPSQKRPLTKQSSEEEIKPKVQKVKIPDWDYKSRFLELQKKHGVVVDNLKNSKTQLSNLKNMEEEIVSLREGAIKKELEISSLEKYKDSAMKEIRFLRKENSELQNDFTQLTESHKSLDLQCNELRKENEENVSKLLHLQNSHSELKTDYNKLEESHRILKSKFENVTAENEANLNKLHDLEKSHSDVKTQLEKLTGEYQNQELLVETLKQIIEEHENLRRVLHNNIQDLKGNIRVFCRVRPPNSAEQEKQLCSMLFPDESSLEIRKMRESVSTVTGKPTDLKQEFSFDKVFQPEATQAEVFEELSQLVQSALDGYQVCVFAYGQTGSGKTYTMQGSPYDDGMIPRTIDTIFEKINRLKLSGWTYKVTASFLEIYNENVRDLLEPNSSHNYEVRYNEGRGVTVRNLKIITINEASEMKRIMEEAHKNRAVAATDFNLHSSRSHAVTKIHVKGYNEASKIKYQGSINLVDLAGSESAKTSSAERLTETKNINKSLSTLGNVMLALHNKDPHVPYRNSKLTFLLQSCLGGNSKTLMFVNISPFEECYGETINSLRFATKVRDIKTHARKNKGYIPALHSQKSVL